MAFEKVYPPGIKSVFMSPQGLLQVAGFFGSHSTDTSTQNGAVLAKNGVPYLETGAWNKIPDGVAVIAERTERPGKYKYFEHAERGAIFKAAKNGIATQGLTLVCPFAACIDCARAIIESGISELLTLERVAGDVNPAWLASIGEANEMLAEAGVKISRPIRVGQVGNTRLRRDGKVLEI